MYVLLREDTAAFGQQEAYEAHLKTLAEAAKAHPGWLSGLFLRFAGYGNRYVIIGRFATSEARQAFVASPLFPAIYGEKRSLVTQPPRIEYYEEVVEP